MQKTLLTVICFFFPLFVFPDVNPILQLLLVGILYEAKITVGLMLLSLLAGFWSIIAFFKFLLGGLRFAHFIEMVIAIGICWAAFSGAKYKFRNLHQRPLRLLRGEISLIPDFQKIKQDWAQTKRSLVLLSITIKKIKNISDKRQRQLIFQE
jgi:hypothetical protein